MEHGFFKMNTSILMRHFRIWVNELQYESYKIDGIVVGDSISFSNLKAAIAAELDIDVSRKEIEIRYIVEGCEDSAQAHIESSSDFRSYIEDSYVLYIYIWYSAARINIIKAKKKRV